MSAFCRPFFLTTVTVRSSLELRLLTAMDIKHFYSATTDICGIVLVLMSQRKARDRLL